MLVVHNFRKMNKVTINLATSFSADIEATVSTTHKALKSYSDGFALADKLDENLPLFLDTNVLLEYYTISFSERKQVKQFLTKNKERIYLTSQIESEFLKHRIDRINSYQKSLESFLSDFQKVKENVDNLKEGKISNFQHYVSTNKILANDYENIKNDLELLYQDISDALKGIFSSEGLFERILDKESQISEAKKKLEGEADIERNDDLLEIVSEFKVTSKLSDEELLFLNEKYKELKEEYDKIKDNQSNKVKKAFPGCGEKDNFKVGDFIIYHEMIKFMKESQTNVIFLTADVTKDDWLLRNKASLVPFTHYIINHFVHTDKMLYIFPAKDKIRVSYDNVYSENSTNFLSENKDDVLDDNIENSELHIENSEFNEVINSETATNISSQLKILGKIELPTSFYSQPYKYKKITEEEFVSELGKSQDWAETYGDGFVGLDYFIKKILGYSKNYDIRTSYSVKDDLLAKQKVETWTYDPSDISFHEVEAIRLKE